jgi:hypothetical protein
VRAAFRRLRRPGRPLPDWLRRLLGRVPSAPAPTLSRMSLPDSTWRAKPYAYADADAVGRELGLSPVVASILARRGCDTPDRARRFIAGDERHDPFDFAAIGEACELILDHVGRGSRIVVHGDYDVDGVASTAILLRALRVLGADPRWLLPSRFEEGYGLARS